MIVERHEYVSRKHHFLSRYVEAVPSRGRKLECLTFAFSVMNRIGLLTVMISGGNGPDSNGTMNEPVPRRHTAVADHTNGQYPVAVTSISF